MVNQGRTAFAQLMSLVPHKAFARCREGYRGNHQLRSFSCWDQLLGIAFAQLSYRESLRDIEVCRGAIPEKLYRMGIRGRVARSTLADANKKRNWRIVAEFAQVLIGGARRLYAGGALELELAQTVYALDSATIDLCLSVFPWTRFRTTNGGVKLQMLLDLRGNIPSFLHITEAPTHDVRVLDALIPETGSPYLQDRGYVDFDQLKIRCSARASVRRTTIEVSGKP
jgi:hypothetical protein